VPEHGSRHELLGLVSCFMCLEISARSFGFVQPASYWWCFRWIGSVTLIGRGEILFRASFNVGGVRVGMIYIFRLSSFLCRCGVPVLPRFLYGINRILFSIVLPPRTNVGAGVLFRYSGLGVVVHERCSIGNRVQIGHNVTLGGRSGLHDVPIIGDDVEIGAGACVLGPVVVGAGARIGANAVVLKDVPPGVVVVGIPARQTSRHE
jgi:serine O-acetyltransferase